ncbi:MAG: MFS transporter [Bacillota bacterium]
MNDIYPAFLMPLLPLFVSEFGISLTLAGVLSAVLSTTSSLVQPLVGHLADTSGSRAFIVLGPAITALSMGMIGLATGPAMLVTLLAIGGVGSAMFHPQGAAMAGAIDHARKGFMLSAFTTAGEAGYALGPLLVLSVVTTLGLRHTYLTILPGILVAVFIYYFAPSARASHATSRDPKNDGNGRLPVRPLAVLWLMAALRLCVSSGFTAFLPLYLKEMGLPLVAYGSVASMFLLAGTVGVMVGGPLADRVGAFRLLVIALVAPIPLFLAFLNTSGIISYVFLAVAAAILYAPMPVITMTAQNLAPGRAGTVSALMMGVAWGAGSLGLIGVGAIADALGIRTALTFLLAALVAAAGLGYGLEALVRRSPATQRLLPPA